MAVSSDGLCCVADDVLDKSLEGLGLLVERLLVLASVVSMCYQHSGKASV